MRPSTPTLPSSSLLNFNFYFNAENLNSASIPSTTAAVVVVTISSAEEWLCLGIPNLLMRLISWVREQDGKFP